MVAALTMKQWKKELFCCDRICFRFLSTSGNPVRSTSWQMPVQVKTTMYWLVAISPALWRTMCGVSTRVSELCKLLAVGATCPYLRICTRKQWQRGKRLSSWSGFGWVTDRAVSAISAEGITRVPGLFCGCSSHYPARETIGKYGLSNVYTPL